MLQIRFFALVAPSRLIINVNSELTKCTCVGLTMRFLKSFIKFSPSFANDCAAITLIGLGGTLKVAFVRKARLTLFHFESCCCIFGVGVIASSIVEYWKQTSHSACHGRRSRLARGSIAAEFRGNVIYNVIFLVDKYGAFRPNVAASCPQTRVEDRKKEIPF